MLSVRTSIYLKPWFVWCLLSLLINVFTYGRQKGSSGLPWAHGHWKEGDMSNTILVFASPLKSVKDIAERAALYSWASLSAPLLTLLSPWSHASEDSERAAEAKPPSSTKVGRHRVRRFWRLQQAVGVSAPPTAASWAGRGLQAWTQLFLSHTICPSPTLLPWGPVLSQ